MTKRNKTVAKIHTELKNKETSLKSKIKNSKDETERSEYIVELDVVQYRLKRGAPNFGIEE